MPESHTQQRCLGKKLGVVHDPRTFLLRNFMELVKPPKTSDNARKLTFPMYANDRLGDCTCASAAHAQITWQRKITILEQQVIDAYNKVNGGRDDGAYALDVLNLWRNTGIGGRTIKAFLKIPTSIPSRNQVKLAVSRLDGVYAGISIPEGLDLDAKRWIPPKNWNGKFRGGHMVWAPYYTEASLGFVTWTERKTMSWDFFHQFVDEVYAIVSPDEAVQEHLDIAKLDHALASLH